MTVGRVHPEWEVGRIPASAGVSSHDDALWAGVEPLPPFRRAEDGAPARWATTVRLVLDGGLLRVRFECEDVDAWGTHRRRDDPIYEEEAVEVFLAPGKEDPRRYFEIEVSPLGTLLDAEIVNPTSERGDLRADLSWDCPGLLWSVASDPGAHRWRADLSIPLEALAPAGVPPVWRANFHRIERPRELPPEFSSWSPTFVTPPDFHKPERFGTLVLRGS